MLDHTPVCLLKLSIQFSLYIYILNLNLSTDSYFVRSCPYFLNIFLYLLQAIYVLFWMCLNVLCSIEVNSNDLCFIVDPINCFNSGLYLVTRTKFFFTFLSPSFSGQSGDYFFLNWGVGWYILLSSNVN